MDQSLQAVATALTLISKVANWQIVGILASVGAFSMGILQVIKELTPLRTEFQRRWVRRWLSNRLSLWMVEFPNVERLPPAPQFDDVETSLVSLATGGDANALYGLPAEQLVGQLNAAAQVTLDSPGRYYGPLIVLSQGSDLPDLLTLLTVSAEQLKLERMPQPYLDARNRVGHRIQRNLDGMQISLSARWKFFMQAASIALSALIIEAGIVATSNSDPRTLAVGLVIGVVGGYLAPVARDMLAALQTLRK